MLRIFLTPTVLAMSLLVSTGQLFAEDVSRTAPVPSYLVARDLPPQLVALEQAGRIAAAEEWLIANIPQEAGASHPLVVERERLRRLRRDFSQSPEELLAAIKQSIPDIAAEDIHKWRVAGQLQWVEIDGELLYFRKEPRNLFRVSEEARRRRDVASDREASTPEGDPNTRTTRRYDLHDHVEKLLAKAAESDDPMVGNVHVHATHRVIVDAGAVPEGETIRCWIPFPQEYRQQQNVKLVSTYPEEATVAPDGHAQRTVYLEMPAPPADHAPEFRIEYTYDISGYVPELDASRVTPLSEKDPVFVEYTKAEPPHVDITPEVKALAAQIIGDEKNPLLKAEKIFRWMDSSIRYCSEMEYSIMTSITDKVMTERKGDCGIFVLMFVTLCRAADVPARWQSGWAMRPESENLHDWAEFYVEPYGWLPADPSYGLRNHENPQVRDFYFGHLDAYRMIANMDYAEDFTPPKTHWRSDNIDNQRGEVEWSGGNIYYDRFTYRMDVDYTFDE